MTPKEYDALVRQLSPSSPIGKDTALAFVVGGGICAVGQLIANGWQALGLTQQEAASATSVTLVFLSVLLTALGLYHRLPPAWRKRRRAPPPPARWCFSPPC